MSATGKVVPIRTLDQAVEAIHRKFAEENDSARKAQRCRIACGQMLVALRKRIEDGEAGDEWKDNWWGWFKKKFVRSRKDAEKVMALASSDDPEAAHDAAKAKNAGEARRSRERKRAADVSGNEEEDLVDQALRLVAQMDATQRRRFFAKCKEQYQ